MLNFSFYFCPLFFHSSSWIFLLYGPISTCTFIIVDFVITTLIFWNCKTEFLTQNMMTWKQYLTNNVFSYSCNKYPPNKLLYFFFFQFFNDKRIRSTMYSHLRSSENGEVITIWSTDRMTKVLSSDDMSWALRAFLET